MYIGLMVDQQHQAALKRIDVLNADVRKLQHALAVRDTEWKRKLERYSEFHDYWQSILDACEKSEVVQGEFCRFMVAVKLCIDENVPGLTGPKAVPYTPFGGQPDLFENL